MTVRTEQWARAKAMERLDAIVASRPSDEQYSAALALYEASRQGVLTRAAPPVTVMYEWVVKWAFQPGARANSPGGSGKPKSRPSMGLSRR
jgi:hypothetical protein